MKKAKQIFTSLSTKRTGVLMNNGFDFDQTKYIKKRHLTKEQSILRKIVVTLINVPQKV